MVFIALIKSIYLRRRNGTLTIYVLSGVLSGLNHVFPGALDCYL